MKLSRKMVAVLLALLVIFTAGTLFLGRREQKTEESSPPVAYYLTAYDSQDDVLAVVVENETGTLTIVHSSGIWFTDTDLPGVEPDEEAVSELFQKASRIRTGQPVEGADPEDPQFGLTAPAAKILVEDVNEGGMQFLIGARVPEKEAYYVCANGGKEVFTLSTEYEEAFLGDVTQYLDLRVLAGIDLSSISSLTLKTCVNKGTDNKTETQKTNTREAETQRSDKEKPDPDKTDTGNTDTVAIQFSLKETGSGNVTGLKFYSLTEPLQLPLSAALYREKILTPLDEMRASGVTAEETVTEKDAVKEMSVTDADGAEHLYRIGEKKDGFRLVTAVGKGMTFEVPQEALTWTQADETDLLGGRLLTLNAGELAGLVLSAGTAEAEYEITGSGKNLAVTVNGKELSFAEFTGNVLDPLNRISIEKAEGDRQQQEIEEVLRCTVLSRKEAQEISLVFYETEHRKCLISVNGKTAFLCDSSALTPLMAAAEAS